MSIGYTWEKLYGAVLALMSSDGPLQDRLAIAYWAIHILTPEDFPDEELRKEYTQLVHALHPSPPGRMHSPVAPAPAVLSPDQARAVADKLLRLYTDLTRLEEQHYRSLSTRDL